MFDSSSRSWADTWEQWPVIRARDSGESEEQTEQILWSLRAYLLIHVILGGVLTEQQTKSRDYYLTWHSVARARAAEQICSDFSLFLSVFPRVAAAAAVVQSTAEVEMTIWFFVCFPICDEIVLMISAPVSGAQVSVAVKASRGWISPTLSVNSNGSNLSFITTDADGFSHLVFIQLSNSSLSHICCGVEMSAGRRSVYLVQFWINIFHDIWYQPRLMILRK